MLWYEQKNKSIALSTRVRLARNLKGVPFPSRLDKAALAEVNKRIADAVAKCNIEGVKLVRVDMTTLGETEIFSMVERHVVSPKFAQNSENRILMLSEDESISIMIGEEDHLRIQVIKSGLCLEEAYALCDKIEADISRILEFAFLDDLGFLTECPTNLGTGMRASVMLHLPVLETTGELKQIASTVAKIGLVFRGFYGEGSDAKASMYQLSNQITLGVSESAALENLNNIAKQIMEKEEIETKNLSKSGLEDSVFRAFGTLKYARKLKTEEMMRHISMLMLGERAGVIKLPETIVLMNVFIISQPAMLKRVNGEKAPNERDEIRAKSIREILEKAEI